MNVVSQNGTYDLFASGVDIYSALPARMYSVGFSKERGFFLRDYPMVEIKEKTYGVCANKVEKILHTFNSINRNLGVILSGDKGIGKSLTAKMLCIRAIESGFPVIIADTYLPGIADYLNRVDGRVMILFDEFEKTFGKRDDFDPQAEMLSLFDGLSSGQKLFCITCNDLGNLNDFLVNRPGRFHYHLRFDYPTEEQIREYLQDKVDAKYWGEIDKVVSFSRKVNLNYDCLRSIAFEVNLCGSFEDAIADLNIIRERGEMYNIFLTFDNGARLRAESVIDLFSSDEVAVRFYSSDHIFVGTLEFIPMDNHFDFNSGHLVIPADKAEFKIPAYIHEDSDDPDDAKVAKVYGTGKMTSIVLNRETKNRSMRFFAT